MGIHMITPLYELVIKRLKSFILEVTADGYWIGIRDEWLHEPPTHWDKVRTEDSVFDPDWGAFGFHGPNYVFERFEFNDDFYGDFYILEDPPAFSQPISKLTLHGKLGRNLYPYGKYAFSVRTQGTNYNSPIANLQPGLEWESYDYLVNPRTLAPWTRQEIKDLEIGIWLGKEAAYGRAVCDKLYAEVSLIL